MNLTIQENSKNYAAQVIRLPHKIAVPGLDNLVEVNYQGNSCLVSKDSDEDRLYLFFPAECKLSETFLSLNNLFRHSDKNRDQTKAGFFEDHGRCKTIKFKGVISSGFIIPLESLMLPLSASNIDLKVGDEFTHIDGIEICTKYQRPRDKVASANLGNGKVKEELVDSKFTPEHMDTGHLMKNVHKLDIDSRITVSYKLHGTSARYFNAPVKRKLNWKEKLAKWFKIPVVEEEYGLVSASRRVIKSVDSKKIERNKTWERLDAKGRKHTLDLFLGYKLKTEDYNKYREVFPLDNDDLNNISLDYIDSHFNGFKNYFETKHAGFYNSDLWSQIGEQYFKDNLNKGEAVYCEIIGKTYSGEAIQHGYTYSLEKPEVYIYRISNINTQGIEIDLSQEQMKHRAEQLGVKICPEFFVGRVGDFIRDYGIGDDFNIETQMNDIFYRKLLEQPSILDRSVVEEGFCIRLENYPRPLILKIKSKKFLLHEGVLLDKEVIDIEEEQNG